MLTKLLALSSALIARSSAKTEINMSRVKKIDINTNEKYSFEYGEYVTTINIGSPPQAIHNVVLDTGSYMPWVKVDGWCTDKTCPGVKPVYNPKLSTTFSDDKTKTYAIKYGTGSMKGIHANDNFCFSDTQTGTCF